MPLHRRSDRGQLVNPAGGGPLPKLKVKRGPDGRLEVEDRAARPPVHEEARPDERPPFPDDPAPVPNPHTQVI
jgi:hypothetical protein